MCYLFHNKIINSKYKRRLIFQPSFYKISKLVLKHTKVLQAERYYFLAAHIYSLNTKCLAKTFFDCFCKEKIREVVVDIVRHLFSRRRTIAYQLFAKKLFGE